MSATDELRKLLDECGVEWESEDCPGIDGKVVYRYTCWGDGGSCYYCEPFGAEPGTLGATCDFSAIGVTPEQAIAATLGDADATGERQRDAVEVVRCRDCERFAVDQSDHDYRTGWWCKRWCTDMVKPDGFCAWGERREG